MTKDEVRQIALDAGFKLKEQPNGELDLNPYVYEFSEQLIKGLKFPVFYRRMWSSGDVQFWLDYEASQINKDPKEEE